MTRPKYFVPIIATISLFGALLFWIFRLRLWARRQAVSAPNSNDLTEVIIVAPVHQPNIHSTSYASLSAVWWGGLALGMAYSTYNLLLQSFEWNLLIFVLPAILLPATLIILFGGEFREDLFSIARTFRSRPALAWFLFLCFGFLALIQFELRAMTTISRLFWICVAVWLISFLAFGGLNKSELRVIGSRLAHSRATGPLISLTTLVLILIVGELFFRHGLRLTSTYADTLVHHRWNESYWNPLNELSFRDYPIQYQLPAGVKSVLILGDSFAAGLGVRDIKDTFPHLLGEKLGDDYHISVVAHAGWNTDAQLDGLKNYPLKPDILIHSYFLNDITYLGSQYLNEWSVQRLHPGPPFGELIDRFYLPNFLYWNVYMQYVRHNDVNYGDGIIDIYRDPDIWSAHKADLQAILDWTHAQGGDTIVIIWPILTMVEASAPATEQIAIFYRSQGVPVINLTEDFKIYRPLELAVNPFDMHPNERAHRIAAERLYALMKVIYDLKDR